jgi:hypothetical protein
MLACLALGKPLQLKEWSSDMDGKILPAQLKLHEAIVQRRISDVRGRRGPPGSKKRIAELLSDSEFTLLVTPEGTLTIHPAHKRRKFQEKYGIDLDNWVREIDFDRDEGEQACSASLAPCQGRPAQPPAAPTPETGTGPEESPPPPPAAPAQETPSEFPSAKQLGIMKAPKQKTAFECLLELSRQHPKQFGLRQVLTGTASGENLAHRAGVSPDVGQDLLRAIRTYFAHNRASGTKR